jgi:hypothetical protein
MFKHFSHIATSMVSSKLVLACVGIFLHVLAVGQQTVRGKVTDEKNMGIPFARVYVKNDADLRVQSDINGVYEMRLFPGEYYLVVSASGFDDRETYVIIKEADVERNVQLFPTVIKDLENVEVSVKKSNPGRDIMLEVVKIREKINPWNYDHTVDVYIKSTEKITRTGKSKEKDKNSENEQVSGNEIEDPFEQEKKKLMSVANDMNLLEIQIQRNFSPPTKVKEFRTAYTLRGSEKQFYYKTTVKSNFNFFENLLHLDDLHQSPVSSPISSPGILSYKYRLEAQYEENGRKIHKIKIIPRNTATTTLSGYIYVIDSVWLVQKLELSMEKGNLLKYDYFTIEQTFEHPGDSLCVLKTQTLTYGTKFKDEVSACKTLVSFKKYNFSPNFSPKFFGNELAVTEKEAYKKDSTFWNEARGTTLTEEEKRYIIVKDSIRDRLNRKEYLDSIDAVFNKVNFWKVVWFGVDHRDRIKRTQWTINSVAAAARPLYIAGPRIAPGFNFFKKWENEKTLDMYIETSIGFLNNDIKGRTWWRYRYDPFHFGTIGASFFHEFDAIRSFDAITQIYKRSNFIEATQLRLFHDYEYFNGFYINPELIFVERRNLTGYKFLTGFETAIPNDDPTDFIPYQAALAQVTISYVPGQKYMREPYRKVLLGSKWPTFYLYYEKGIPKIFGSDINHDYLLGGIRQSFKIGTLGTTNYHVKAGKFINDKELRDADLKFPRRSDPFWFSNPLYSFQGLDTSLPSRDVFIEGHFVHHDNGAVINKLPFMKKTGIGLVIGGGFLYAKEFKIFHYEALAGLERSFKFSKRRLRIGIYAAASDGNYTKPTTTWKVSFAVLDDRNMKWNF